jgi:hypothetical protein
MICPEHYHLEPSGKGYIVVRDHPKVHMKKKKRRKLRAVFARL